MQKVHNDQRLKELLDLLKLDENQLSCVCLAILDNAKIGLTYGELILLNVGAFVTLFAMSGVSILASLVGIGIICYTIGGLKFEKKDLPL